MMKNFIRIFSMLLFLSPSLALAQEKTVILLSFDGVRADALDEGVAPNFNRLARDGWQGDLTPIFPTETFPNHATLITGCTAEEHGIVSNKFIDSQKGEFAYAMDPSWLKCKPVWASLEEKGIKTAVIYWPLHGHGKWNGKQPAYQQAVSTEDIKQIIKFDDTAKFQKILSLLRLPQNQRPRFIFSWFAEIDTAGHAFGPRSEQVKDAIKVYDKLLGEFASKLRQLPHANSIDLVIVSDHGMTLVETGISVPYLQTELKKMGTDSAKIIESGSNARIYVEPKEQKPTLKCLRSLARQSKAFDIYEVKKLPQKWQDRDPRNGQLLLVAHSKNYFAADGLTDKLLSDVQAKPTGKHGYKPTDPDMKAVFIGNGPDFVKHKSRMQLMTTEVAPLILKWIGNASE